MRLCLGICVLVGLLASCKDAGTDPPTPGPPTGSPATISGIYPSTAAVGDTVLIEGSGFGTAQGTGSVDFGSTPATIYAQWTNTRILAVIPSGATSTGVRVMVDGVQSSAASFTVQATPDPRISFSGQVKPLFQANGCIVCHGGTNNLVVDSYSNLMSGTSANGPVVVPYKGEESIIVKKLRGTASFGARMPQGGPFLSASDILVFVRWINQGARNN